MGTAPLGGAEREERFPHARKHPHSREINWERAGASRDRRGMKQLVCGRQDRVRPRCMAHAEALSIPA